MHHLDSHKLVVNSIVFVHCVLMAEVSAVKLVIRQPQSLSTHLRKECKATVVPDRVMSRETCLGVSQDSTKLNHNGNEPDKDSARPDYRRIAEMSIWSAASLVQRKKP